LSCQRAQVRFPAAAFFYPFIKKVPVSFIVMKKSHEAPIFLLHKFLLYTRRGTVLFSGRLNGAMKIRRITIRRIHDSAKSRFGKITIRQIYDPLKIRLTENSFRRISGSVELTIGRIRNKKINFFSLEKLS